MRIERQILVAAPRGRIWAYLTEPANVLDFMEGIVRWDVAGARATGLGARYEIRMKVGTAFVGGLVEIVEWDEGKELAWTSLTGIDQRGRFRLRDRGDETEVTLRFSYVVPGGLFGWITEWLAAGIVGENAARSLENLKLRLETDAGSARARRRSRR